jgi:hypothetical protein
MRRSRMNDLPSGLLTWWLGLCTVSAINIGLLARFWITHLKKRSNRGQRAYLRQRQLLWLSSFFVLGCAFRAFLPRADLRRITLVDSPLSSILVGRTVATIAELCFAAQWAILLKTFARPAKLNGIVTFSRLILPAILIAEIFSWRGVLTTNNFWHFLEESVWGSCEIGLTASALVMRRRYQGSPKQFMGWMAVCGAIYVTYMFTLDIPTYYSRWRLDQVSGKIYTGFREGLTNLAFQWTTTHNPKDWEGEFIWMMIYFSLAVWVSLAFTQAPIDRLDEGFGLPKNTPA